jgi:hypothetical protein
MIAGVLSLAGAAVGAVAMYLFDETGKAAHDAAATQR